MTTFKCLTCGQEWPENYCPACAHTIVRTQTQPPPIPRLPHPQHRNFVRTAIPEALIRHRSGFLHALSGERASRTLQEYWHKIGAVSLPLEKLVPPAGLSVSSFQHARCLCYLILLPPPQAAGESYFAFLVAGPADDWSPEARGKVPVRYFLLERTMTGRPALFEWSPSASKNGEIFEPLGPGPAPQDPRDFVAKILTHFYGLKPAADNVTS